jgi:hypothetical protein
VGQEFLEWLHSHDKDPCEYAGHTPLPVQRGSRIILVCANGCGRIHVEDPTTTTHWIIRWLWSKPKRAWRAVCRWWVNAQG